MGRDISKLHPTLQMKLAQLKEVCEKKGIKILFGECLRTKAEQDALYAQGRTKSGKIITNAKGSSYSSQHQWGIAADFYLDMDVDGDGKKADDAFNNSTRLFNEVGAVAKSIGLGWGGTWKSFKDLPHLYLKDWGDTASKLKSIYGTPEKFMQKWNDGKTIVGAINKINEKSLNGYERTQFIIDVQRTFGIKTDGKAGNQTLKKTVTISESKNRNHPVIKYIQNRLNALGYNCGLADGIAGRKFTEAVKKYQKDHGCVADGEITAGKKTWKSLLGME